MKANSSYDQLVDLDPTCNQGLFHGQEKITDLEKSLFKIPTSSLHQSMIDMESTSSFGFLNPHASFSSLPSLSCNSREDLNSLLASCRQASSQDSNDINSILGSVYSNTNIDKTNSSKDFHGRLGGNIVGVGDQSSFAVTDESSRSHSSKRLFQYDEHMDAKKRNGIKDDISERYCFNNTSNSCVSNGKLANDKSVSTFDLYNNEDISNIEKLVIERSAGLLMKMG